MAEITEAEVLAELERLSREHTGDDGLTGPEWARKLGIHEKAARDLLGRAKAQGMLVVGSGYREALDGRRSKVAVYKVRKP